MIAEWNEKGINYRKERGMSELNELIERCKQAQGRDPWLNRDIEVALGRGRDCDDTTRQKDAYAMPLHRDDYYVPPEYTRSFDAALQLMPCPMHINLKPIDPPDWGPHIKWVVDLVRLDECDPIQGWLGFGANPALALTGAFLLSIRAKRRRDAKATGAG